MASTYPALAVTDAKETGAYAEEDMREAEVLEFLFEDETALLQYAPRRDVLDPCEADYGIASELGECPVDRGPAEFGREAPAPVRGQERVAELGLLAAEHVDALQPAPADEVTGFGVEEQMRAESEALPLLAVPVQNVGDLLRRTRAGHRPGHARIIEQ